jgi:hypothetical protein
MASTSVKISATIQCIILFILVSMPMTYKLTNRLFGGMIGSLADSHGCPTGLGIFIHSLVFGLITYILMGI